MSVGRKIFITVALIMVTIVLGQALWSEKLVGDFLKKAVQADIDGHVGRVARQIRQLYSAVEADVDIIRAHNAIDDFLMYMIFDDAESMEAEVDTLEEFLRRIHASQPQYTLIQLVGQERVVLQLNKGERTERFTKFDNTAALHSLQDRHGGGSSMLILHRLSHKGEALMLETVGALAVDGAIEGLIRIEQSVSDFFNGIFERLDRQGCSVVITDDNGAVVAASPGLSREAAGRLVAGEAAEWLADRQTLPDLGLVVTVAKRTAEAYGILDTLLRNMIVVIAVSVVISITVVGWAVSRLVSRPIAAVSARMDEIAHGDGDLTVTLDEGRRDEIGELARAFNQFVEKIRVSVMRISGSIEELNNQARCLAEVTAETNAGASRQQMETAQLADAATEMSSTAAEVAKIAADAAGFTARAGNAVESSRETVRNATRAADTLAQKVMSAADVVKELAGHSKDIDAILEVIGGVAEQTNLLALNAAIEAARAGEHGRGFAVVADEVRQLAKNTQDSTLKIRELTENLQEGAARAEKEMDSGRSMAEQSVEQAMAAVNSLDVIGEVVERLNELIVQVSAATEQQGTVIEDVNRNAAVIAEIAAATAEGARKTSQTTQAMGALAMQLEEAVGHFRTSHGTPAGSGDQSA